jgi:hypothetical protein
MANILMKSGEIREVSDEKILSFLEENRDLIQTRHSARRRPVKKREITNCNYLLRKSLLIK